MKKKLVYTTLLIALIFSCKKATVRLPATMVPDSLSLADVKAFVGKPGIAQTSGTKHTFDLSALTIPWEKAHSLHNNKGNYWLIPLSGMPVFGHVGQGYRKLALMRDSSGQLIARILEIIPDGIRYQRDPEVRTDNFTGRIFIYDEHYKLLGGRIYGGGKPIGQIRPAISVIHPPGAQVAAQITVMPDCQWIDTSYMDAEGVLTIYSEMLCTFSISIAVDNLDFGQGDYAGSDGDPSHSPEFSNLPGELGEKIDPSAFMKCFGLIADANSTMKVTVYVQEPFPGTTFNYGPNSVGHTAIGLTKSDGTNTITQVVGFYPNATGKDKMHAPSKIVDNSGLDYNVSITYNVSAIDFNKIVAYVSNPPAIYDLVTFNCTDFVFYACASGDVDIPNCYGSIGLQTNVAPLMAMTPAALGNSIEGMKGKTGVNTDKGIIPNSKGPCN